MSKGPSSSQIARECADFTAALITVGPGVPLGTQPAGSGEMAAASARMLQSLAPVKTRPLTRQSAHASSDRATAAPSSTSDA